MSNSINDVFSAFMNNCVNLDPEKTEKAKNSREWLIGQMKGFSDDVKFPINYSEKNIYYGSFSRKTKTRPLNDIDLMFCFKANGCEYSEYEGVVKLSVPDSAVRFNDFVNEGTCQLNSRKLINALVLKLKDIGQYKSAEIKRNQEAATLNLASYDWVYDIVPCFFTTPESDGRTYYIIPDGMGNWKKTDPRFDVERFIRVNKAHNGQLPRIIRIIKYWNKRPTMPTLPSYLLENMILDYYGNREKIASEYIDCEFTNVIGDLITRVNMVCNDPKAIQGNLNNVPFDERNKVTERARLDYKKAYSALELEKEGKIQESLSLWAEIFGSEFKDEMKV